jgi:hypothetical protein
MKVKYASKYCGWYSAGTGMVIGFSNVVKPGQVVQEKKGEQVPSASAFFGISCFAI